MKHFKSSLQKIKHLIFGKHQQGLRSRDSFCMPVILDAKHFEKQNPNWTCEEISPLNIDQAADFALENAANVYQALWKKGIAVRNPGDEKTLRISVGTREECEMLINALGAILKGRNR